jgi:hypothetical protein
MLISMPHGTSTIFGAFQAILALLVKGIDFRPRLKLSRDGKFASEIFCNEMCVCVAVQQQGRCGIGLAIKSKLDQRLPGLFLR